MNLPLPNVPTLLALALASGLGAAALGTSAQLEGLDPNAFVVAEPGAPGSPDELRAWALLRQEKHVEAREIAERIVAERPDGFLGHFLLGWAHHYGEANFPKALFHAERAFAHVWPPSLRCAALCADDARGAISGHQMLGHPM